MNIFSTFYQRWYSSRALSREAQSNSLSEESVQDIFHDPLLNFCPANPIKCPLSFWISWQYDPHSDEHHTERGWRRRKTLQRYSGVYIIDILTETDAVFYVLQNTFNKIQWWLLPQTEQTVLILALKKLCQILPSPHFIHILKTSINLFLRRRTIHEGRRQK